MISQHQNQIVLDELIDAEEKIIKLKDNLRALVQMHKKHYGLDGAWDEELVKAERLLEESGR